MTEELVGLKCPDVADPNDRIGNLCRSMDMEKFTRITIGHLDHPPKSISHLGRIPKLMVIMRFGLHGGKPMSYASLAKEFGFSRDSARWIVVQAIKMCRWRWYDTRMAPSPLEAKLRYDFRCLR